MKRTMFRVFVLLIGWILCTPFLYAFGPMSSAKWCKVINNSGVDYKVIDDDMSSYTTFGTLYVRELGDKTNGIALAKKGDEATIKKNGKYEFYFDTNIVRKFGMHLRFRGANASNDDATIIMHVTNCPPWSIRGFIIAIDCNPMRDCNIAVDPTGFRNTKGGTLFTINKAIGDLGKDAADD